MANSLSDERIARGMATQTETRRQRVDKGEKVVGWKVGFGAPAVLEKFRLENPLVGYLMSSGMIASGSVISMDGWVKPVAEPELFVEMGRDLRGGVSAEEAASAIASIGPAIELADLSFAPEDVERILSDNIFQRHVILGSHDQGRHGARLDGLTGIVKRNDEVQASSTQLEANTGEIIGIVRHVANLLEDMGEGLRAGEFIICGSVVPPIFVERDDKSVEFNLQPIGSVSVRFK